MSYKTLFTRDCRAGLTYILTSSGEDTNQAINRSKLTSKKGIEILGYWNKKADKIK
jgi:hypothetical protein